jgi:hypothetical protein
MKVYTTHGLIDRAELEITDEVTMTDNTRETATEWRLAGELVRRDVWVNVLRGASISGEVGATNGRQ